ncbi:folate-binding protein [Terrihabitans soli]|uniref:Folate-binding protein n=1 Tax=Terrihabitans soli TaxID=708113 RepID=A0A6S6QLL1_9HYPH|nr:folate-binding protein [Terrihabitans soli]BCJ90206.1 folate-binding protein [Terrihabitans soli]
MAFAAVLTDRAAIRVAGEEAPHFLHNLVTSSVEELAEGKAAYAGLLTPQGKIISDFFALRTPDGYLLDVPAARLEELKKRLTLYKLRAKVTITAEDLAVAAIWGGSDDEALSAFEDPRLPVLGKRAFISKSEANATLKTAGLEVKPEDEFHAHRIGLGIPEGGRDFAFDDAFPHEADMDQLGGVDFRKGCYIGQEVVSRTQHRSTARTRIVPVTLSGPAEAGTEIMAGDKTAGTLGSVSGTRGIALLRLDRAEDALAAGEVLKAGSAVLTIDKPDWAKFRFPGEPVPDKAS